MIFRLGLRYIKQRMTTYVHLDRPYTRLLFHSLFLICSRFVPSS